MVDTSSIIDYLWDKEENGIVEGLLKEARSGISIISIYEIFCGVYSKSDWNQCHYFIELSKRLDLTVPVTQMAAEIYQYLRKEGQLIANEDILIAATAIYGDYALLTRNKKDFIKIPQLKLFE